MLRVATVGVKGLNIYDVVCKGHVSWAVVEQ